MQCKLHCFADWAQGWVSTNANADIVACNVLYCTILHCIALHCIADGKAVCEGLSSGARDP